MSNQERRLMRRMARHTETPRETGFTEWMENELDEKRDRLAERLLEIGLESARADSFTDTAEKQVGAKGYDTEPVISLEDWYLKHANAALKAATVIYPEIPTQGGANAPMTAAEWAERNVAESAMLPDAAQEGIQNVGGFPEERPGSIEALRAEQLRGEG